MRPTLQNLACVFALTVAAGVAQAQTVAPTADPAAPPAAAAPAPVVTAPAPAVEPAPVVVAPAPAPVVTAPAPVVAPAPAPVVTAPAPAPVVTAPAPVVAPAPAPVVTAPAPAPVVTAPAPVVAPAPAPVVVAPAPVPAPVTVPAAPPALTCTPGARLFVFDDGAWYAATARDATATTQLCLVRFDGYGEDEDKAVSLKDAVAWQLDGPGRAVTDCVIGERVVVQDEGAWHPAKVLKNMATAGCRLHFDDPEMKDDVYSLKLIRRMP